MKRHENRITLEQALKIETVWTWQYWTKFSIQAKTRRCYRLRLFALEDAWI